MECVEALYIYTLEALQSKTQNFKPIRSQLLPAIRHIHYITEETALTLEVYYLQHQTLNFVTNKSQ